MQPATPRRPVNAALILLAILLASAAPLRVLAAERAAPGEYRVAGAAGGAG